MSMFHCVPGVPRAKMERFDGFSVATKAAQGRRWQTLPGQNSTRAKHVV